MVEFETFEYLPGNKWYVSGQEISWSTWKAVLEDNFPDTVDRQEDKISGF